MATESVDDLEKLIFEHTPDDLETRLRMIIAYARDGKKEPKDIYVQLIKKVYTRECARKMLEIIGEDETWDDYGGIAYNRDSAEPSIRNQFRAELRAAIEEVGGGEK